MGEFGAKHVNMGESMQREFLLVRNQLVIMKSLFYSKKIYSLNLNKQKKDKERRKKRKEES